MKLVAKIASIRSATAILAVLLIVAHVPFVGAAKPSAVPAKSSKAKASKAGKKPSAKSHRRKPPALDLDSGDANDTLESALENYETMLAVIANNIANADTPGFKRSRAIVEDLGYRQEGRPGVQDAANNYSPGGFSVGSGSQIVGTETDFRQGKLKHTGRELDLAIEGLGFFQVKDPSGAVYYSRAGHLSLNPCGNIVVASSKTGRLLEPAITIPADSTSISISSEGVVSYSFDYSATMADAGTLQLANFINPQGLLKRGENLYEETEASGTATVGSPGTTGSGMGKVRQGWIEKSNVDLRHELTEWKRIRRTCRTIRALLDGP